MQHVRNAVRFRGAIAHPQRVQAQTFALEGLRDNGVAAARARKPSSLAERAHFNSAFLRAFDLVDGMGDGGILDECLVSGVEDDDGLLFLRPGYPSSQLLAGIHGTRGVVRGAQVHNIRFDRRIGQGRKTVIGRRGEMQNAVAGNDIRVYISGVGWLKNKCGYAAREDVQQVGQIVLCAARHENLALLKRNAALLVIILHRLTEKAGSDFRLVTFERFLFRLVIYCMMHGID